MDEMEARPYRKRRGPVRHRHALKKRSLTPDMDEPSDNDEDDEFAEIIGPGKEP